MSDASRERSRRATTGARHSGPGPLGLERLRELVSPGTLRRAARILSTDQLKGFTALPERLEGVVLDDTSFPFLVQVELASGDPRATCHCDAGGEPLCEHAAALLLAACGSALDYDALTASAASDATRGEVADGSVAAALVASGAPAGPASAAAGRALGAVTAVGAEADGRRAREIGRRLQRAERELAETEIVALAEDGQGLGWYAVQAASGATYRVALRAVPEACECSCPDFMTNRLGTCKHLEALRLWLARRGLPGRQVAPARPVLYLHHDPLPRPRLQRSRRVAADVALWLDEFFDEGGALQVSEQRLPELLARCGREPGIEVTRPLREHVARLQRLQGVDRGQAELLARLDADDGAVPGLAVRLPPHQRLGVAFLLARGRAVLADELGLGKTVQAIAAARWSLERGARQVLVVTTRGLLRDWERALAALVTDQVAVVRGDAAARRAALSQAAAFTLIAYEDLVRDLEVVSARPPDVLIVDEAQHINDWRTRTGAVVRLVPAQQVYVLTSAPLTDQPDALYSLTQIVDQHALGPLWLFNARHVRFDSQERLLGVKDVAGLRRDLEGVWLRRTWRELPADQLSDLGPSCFYCALDEGRRATYERAAASLARHATPGEARRAVQDLIEALYQLQGRHAPDSRAKVGLLIQLWRGILSLAGGRYLVLASNERLARLASEAARRLGLPVAVLQRGLDRETWRHHLQRFEGDPGPQLLFCSDLALAELGAELRAEHVRVHFDVPWHPGHLLRRTHATGARRDVLLLHEHSYEEQVAALWRAGQYCERPLEPPDAEDEALLRPEHAGPARAIAEHLVARQPVGARRAGEPLGSSTGDAPLAGRGAGGAGGGDRRRPAGTPEGGLDELEAELGQRGRLGPAGRARLLAWLGERLPGHPEEAEQSAQLLALARRLL